MWWTYTRGACIRGGLIVGGLRYMYYPFHALRCLLLVGLLLPAKKLTFFATFELK
jgi:hypothetical protein